MRILNICADDWANYMYSQSMAMRSIGMDVIALKSNRHSFGYEDQCSVSSDSHISNLIKAADLVQIFHSCKRSANLVRSVNPNIPITVWHTGSLYRAAPKETSNFFAQNNNIKLELTDQCEFLSVDPRLAYVAVAIDIHRIRRYQVEKQIGTRYIVSHYPSKSSVKGTEDILRMMRPLKDLCTFKSDDKIVPHKEQIRRMSEADIYIELFKPVLNGQPYGCFGVTAFEAAALGKIVVTNNIGKDAYESVCGNCELVIANTEYAFSTYMRDLLSMNPAQIKDKQTKTLEWVVEKHSLKATGERIKSILSNLI